MSENNEIAVAKEETYVSPSVPSLQVKLTIDGKSQFVQFKDANYKTSDAVMIKALDDAIADSAGVRSRVSKVDRTAAEAVAKAHMAKNKGGAVQGGLNSANVSTIKNVALDNRDANLARDGVQGAEVVSEQLKKDGLQLTQAADAKPAGVLNLGKPAAS